MKTRTHIYWRVRGGARRAYADLREYADVGDGREALVARGEKRATTDPATAQVLLARRLEQLDGLRRGRALHGLAGQAKLADFARTHLVAKAKTGKVTEAWLTMSENHLKRAVKHFGAARELASITTADVRKWGEVLQASGLSGGTVRRHLNTLSNLYRRARAEQSCPQATTRWATCRKSQPRAAWKRSGSRCRTRRSC